MWEGNWWWERIEKLQVAQNRFRKKADRRNNLKKHTPVFEGTVNYVVVCNLYKDL